MRNSAVIIHASRLMQRAALHTIFQPLPVRFNSISITVLPTKVHPLHCIPKPHRKFFRSLKQTCCASGVVCVTTTNTVYTPTSELPLTTYFSAQLLMNLQAVYREWFRRTIISSLSRLLAQPFIYHGHYSPRMPRNQPRELTSTTLWNSPLCVTGDPAAYLSTRSHM